MDMVQAELLAVASGRDLLLGEAGIGAEVSRVPTGYSRHAGERHEQLPKDLGVRHAAAGGDARHHPSLVPLGVLDGGGAHALDGPGGGGGAVDPIVGAGRPGHRAHLQHELVRVVVGQLEHLHTLHAQARRHVPLHVRRATPGSLGIRITIQALRPPLRHRRGGHLPGLQVHLRLLLVEEVHGRHVHGDVRGVGASHLHHAPAALGYLNHLGRPGVGVAVGALRAGVRVVVGQGLGAGGV
mmetsp:Transcript_95179/g.254457  ORF Transcript_95179/g.254457 Transcript_95179/m.254457 type:complete len:240 (+) Transcript_95179:5044-5763(+)